MSKPRPTPAKAQWARASLKNAMRLPTTSEPMAPQMKQTIRRREEAAHVVSSVMNEAAGQIGNLQIAIENRVHPFRGQFEHQNRSNAECR